MVGLLGPWTFCLALATAKPLCGSGTCDAGLGLLQKSPRIRKIEGNIAKGEDDNVFSPVDGGQNRVCRGASAADNRAEYFTVMSAESLGGCKTLCEEYPHCTGIEYHRSGRCEIWTRAAGVEFSLASDGYTCLRYGPDDFFPVDGAEGRSCRGTDEADDDPAKYTVMSGLSLEECKDSCRQSLKCEGIDHSGTSCKIWVEAIGFSISSTGSTCLKREFTYVDGSMDRVCRGDSEHDNLAAYYTVVQPVPSISACQEKCRNTTGCKGIEFIGSRCEVWTRPEGINVGKEASGYVCMRYHGTSDAPKTVQTDARFLIQATFGPTAAAMSELRGHSYEEWIDRQILLPASLHRAYYRQRVNPGTTGLVSDMRAGRPISRCAAGSRWGNRVVQKSDKGRKIQVQNDRIYVDDLFRSDVDPAFVGNGLGLPTACTNLPPKGWSGCEDVGSRCTKDPIWIEDGYCQQACFDAGLGYEGEDCSGGWPNLTFGGFICDVSRGAVGSWMRLSTEMDCGGSNRVMLIPAVWISQPDSRMMQQLHFGIFRPGILLLQEPPVTCDLGTIIWSDVEGGRFYMLEERLELLHNSIEMPSTSEDGQCSTVPRTFLNERNCVLLPGCLAVEGLSIELSVENLAKFHALGGRYVYAVTGLRTPGFACNEVSRWKKLDCGNCNASVMHWTVVGEFQTKLERARHQGVYRDITVWCSRLPEDAAVPADAIIRVSNPLHGVEFFQHVHDQEGDIFDFTDWALQHPGGPGMITQFASSNYTLAFPASHPMERWETGIGHELVSIHRLGKLGSVLEFHQLPKTLQSEEIAGLGRVSLGESVESCGSPGEVSNQPKLGHHFTIENGNGDDWHYDEVYDFYSDRNDLSRSTVWTMQALTAPDQLRQRLAWALSQIYVCSAEDAGKDGMTEAWLTYYDIFVRNAFGNLRDVLREVTFSPLMGEYMSHKDNKASEQTGLAPNENFAQEVMQLFTIGPWKLNPDGSQVLVGGKPVASYTHDIVMEVARVFTGFTRQATRTNIEYGFTKNEIDPMNMTLDQHDRYPKLNLEGGYLGDGYPLCSDVDPQSFLKKGALYTFRGKYMGAWDGFLLKLSNASELFQTLCFEAEGLCRYNHTVELSKTLACSGQECSTHAIYVKKVIVAGFVYEYVEPPCVALFFFNGQITRRGSRGFDLPAAARCQSDSEPVAGAACCSGCNNETFTWMKYKGYTCENAPQLWPNMTQDFCNNSVEWRHRQYCAMACAQAGVGYDGLDCSKGPFRAERPCGFQWVPFAAAEKACRDKGMEICKKGIGCGHENEAPVWTQESCRSHVIVYPDGTVGSNLSTRSHSRFAVHWKDSFPSVQNGCTGCQVSRETCVCSMTVELRPVFASQPQVSELYRLKIGAIAPSTGCSDCGEVQAYLKSGSYDENTVFGYNGKFFMNKESLVKLGNGSYEFRNPPAFLPDDATPRHAVAEVDGLIDHLIQHQNTAPFISRRLIQRLVTSNPSPAYVKDVAEAFRSGKYAGKIFSGRNGDLAATTAAILLHKEARQPTHPSDGALREPLLKVIHLMRSLEYNDHFDRDIILRDVQGRIGQFPFQQPSALGYYSADYTPENFPDGMVAPEFEILTQPKMIDYLNGLFGLIDNGLSSCSRGFGMESSPCSRGKMKAGRGECRTRTLEQFDLLLTGGRFHDKSLLRAAYATADDHYRAAQKALVLSPEFNTLGPVEALGARAETPMASTSAASDYRAVVMIHLEGGADSFNMLVPLDCALYDEYLQVRQEVALDPLSLFRINATGQACSQFGVHPELDVVKELYDNKELAFVTNVGNLLEPLTLQSWTDGSSSRCLGLFSHLEQQRSTQTLTCQSLQSTAGVGGRMADALAKGSQKMKTMAHSIAGKKPWVKGTQSSQVLDYWTPREIEKYDELRAIIHNMTSVRLTNIYAEEYGKQLRAAVAAISGLNKARRNSWLLTNFSTENKDFTMQLQEVARLISTRGLRGVDRDFFFVRLKGFDTHRSAKSELAKSLESLNHGLKKFVLELKAQQMFDSVVTLTHSEFARTLTPNNGLGTDHGWAGNYVILGGGIKGGKILNSFPSSFLPGNEQDVGRGRLIPKYPFESMMKPIAEWMGVENSQMAQVLPNIGNFNSSAFIDKSALFNI